MNPPADKDQARRAKVPVRASLAEREFLVEPGEAFTLKVEVANTAEVIDAVSATVRGLDGAKVACTPAELRLFPGAIGELGLSVELPRSFPAGLHRGEVEVASATTQADKALCDFVVQVRTLPRASVSLRPLTRRARRKGSFGALCYNLGNVTLEVRLSASDPERALQLKCVPETVVLNPGGSARATLAVRAPRKFFGSEQARAVKLTAAPLVRASQGRRQLTARSGASTSARGPVARLQPVPALEPIEVQGTYLQRPAIPSGVVTAAVLSSIVALWAGIFVLGLKTVLAEQPLTKSAPLSFFSLGSPPIGTRSAPRGAAAAALTPKDIAPLGVAGFITGRVTSPDQLSGVGGVTVQAWQVGPGGGPAASAATLSDGTYQIAGLFPGRYKISFAAPGLRTVWFPDSSSEAGARAIEVAAGTTATHVNTLVQGLPASISGQVVTGEVPAPAVRVSAVAIGASRPGGQAQPLAGSGAHRHTRVTPQGSYLLSHLASPATYVLTFSAPGFLPLQAQLHVGGGQKVLANTVRLMAKPGEIDGMVAAGGEPLGGVLVSALSNGQRFFSQTPTLGEVGHFSLADLPTPAAYLLNFDKAGYGPVSTVVDLGPGGRVRHLVVSLAAGVGTIEGKVSGSGGKPLGGVKVTVWSSPRPLVTETLTSGQVGSYVLSGLLVPGTYAVTYSLRGYESETVGVNLVRNGPSRNVDVTLPLATGVVSGVVTSASTGKGLPGVTVSATDGARHFQTFTTSSPAGHYQLAQLAPGSYTISYSLDGYEPKTALVHIRPGQKLVELVPLKELQK
jgi:hypothetical protein